jgi:hypothetical protein
MVAAAIVAGLLDAWGARYDLNPDGVSYIEMAQHAVANGRIELISGYWSPGYPGLLLPIVRHVAVTAPGYVPALHAVNLLLYLLTLPLFVLLVWRMGLACHAPAGPLRAAVVLLGASAFALIALQGIGLGLLSPDVAVLLMVLVIALCCLGLERIDQSWRWAGALGLALGVGYWTKAILLPLGAILLVLLWLMPPATERARAKLAFAAVIFAAVSTPLIVMVSQRVGHLSTSEVGRLNYAWEVNGVLPFAGWLGDTTSRAGEPIHPPRVLDRDPLTLEFATPVRATYPLWYDPSYWYAGVKAHFDAAGQWQALRRGEYELRQVLEQQWPLIAGLLLLWTATRKRAHAAASRMPLVMVAWAVASTGVYVAVHVESRYLAGFVAITVASSLAALARRTPRRWLGWMIPLTAVGMLVSVVVDLVQTTGGFDLDYRPDYAIAADTLRQLGVRPGDRVAVIGDAFEQYAVFAAQATIAAQVMDSTGYWQMTPAGRADVNQRLASVGVKALLANDVDPGVADSAWHLLVRADSSNLGMRSIRTAP